MPEHFAWFGLFAGFGGLYIERWLARGSVNSFGTKFPSLQYQVEGKVKRGRPGGSELVEME